MKLFHFLILIFSPLIITNHHVQSSNTGNASRITKNKHKSKITQPSSTIRRFSSEFEANHDLELDLTGLFTSLKEKQHKTLIGKSSSRHFLVTIEHNQEKNRFPFYGTFISKIPCKGLNRIITYDHTSKQFFDISIKCNKTITLYLKHGKLKLITENYEKPIINYNSYFLNKLPNQYEFLKDFRNDLFAFNFKPKIDQTFPMPEFIPKYWGYLTNTSHHLKNIPSHQKIVEIPYLNKFRYALFRSNDFNYAFPIHDECYANIYTENAVIEHFCDDSKFSFDLKNGILTYKSVQLLTINIGGIRVLINKDIKQLYESARRILFSLDNILNNDQVNKPKKKRIKRMLKK